MQQANEWFIKNFKNKLDNDTYNNTIMFPIIWNAYESKWWNTDFKVCNIETHVKQYILPKLNRSTDYEEWV